jgi:protein TonB
MTRVFVRRISFSRAMALMVILALHGAALALGLSMSGARSEPVAQVEPIVVSLLAESRPRAAMPVADTHPTLANVMPQLLAPRDQITLPPDAPAVEASSVTAPQWAAGPVAASDAEPDSIEPTLVSDADYLQLPRVVYPPAARRARAQGMVHVRALVDEEGRPADVSVARSSGFELLDGAACNAVRGARFKPYRRNNIARSMVVIVPIEFSIRPRT